MDLAVLMLSQAYMGGVLYGAMDITVTCRDAETRGMPVPAANRRRALFEVWLWPVLLPYNLVVQEDDEEDR